MIENRSKKKLVQFITYEDDPIINWGELGYQESFPWYKTVLEAVSDMIGDVTADCYVECGEPFPTFRAGIKVKRERNKKDKK